MIISQSSDYKSVLIIGDAHANPAVKNDRFDWLGNAILETQPDAIIDMGDFPDMEALCSYDKGKKSFEGRSLKADFAASNDANRRSFGAIDTYNETRINAKKKQYTPERIRLGGNHCEARIKRMLEVSPEFIGTYGMENFEWYNDPKYTYVPFLQPFEYQGISFCHYFYKTLANGMGPATVPAMLNITKKSAVQGHNHLRGFEDYVRPDGSNVCGLFAGCYLDPDYMHQKFAAYAGPQKKWWSGLVWLHGCKDGYFDPEFVSIRRVKKMYG